MDKFLMCMMQRINCNRLKNFLQEKFSFFTNHEYHAECESDGDRFPILSPNPETLKRKRSGLNVVKSDKGRRNDDVEENLTSVSYRSQVKKELKLVEWAIENFYPLHKLYMLDEGPTITAKTGNFIGMPVELKFTLEKRLCDKDTKFNIWLIVQVIDAPLYVDNICAKFDVHVYLDGVMIKTYRGNEVIIPVKIPLGDTVCPSTSIAIRKYQQRSETGRRHDTVENAFATKFNVGPLFDFDTVNSKESYVCLTIYITVFAKETQIITNKKSIQDILKKSEANFSLHIGSLLSPTVTDSMSTDSEGQSEYNEFPDIKLQLDVGTIFHAHRAILAGRSPVFKEMFLSRLGEMQSNTVHISDISPEAMGIILHHIYTGKVDPSCNQLIEEVVYGAITYQLSDLVEYCDKISDNE